MRKEIYNNKSKMNKIIQQLLPTVPTDVCNIIYQYYKPPFLKQIKETNKFRLINRIYYIRGKLIEGKLSKKFHYTKYILHQDEFRYTILGSQRYTLTDYGCYFDNYFNRDKLKQKCRYNGIEFKDRTPTKNLIKKLMKL